MDRKVWSERKAKLDADMMGHPFLKDFTRAQRAAAEENETLALLANYGRHSKKEREENKDLVPSIAGFTQEQVEDYWDKRQKFLNQLIERQGIQRMIRQSIIRDWSRSGPDEEEKIAQSPDPVQDEKEEKTVPSVASGREEQGEKGWFRVVLEDESDYVTLTKRNKWNAFDGLSYMKAVRDSIRSYDADYQNKEKETKASFVNLLASCYARQLNETQKKQVNIAASQAYTLPEEVSRVLNVISDYLKEKRAGCTLENLTQEDELYEQVIQYAAKATKMKPNTIRNLMPILQKIRTESLDAPAGSEGEGKIQDLLPDAATLENMTQDKLEKQDLAFRFLQAVSKKKMKEYNQLLMTNLILLPIHPITGCSVYVQGKKEYTDHLKRNSAGLYKMVFHLPYLKYIEWIEPSGLQQKADALQQKADALQQKADALQQKADVLQQKADVLQQKADVLQQKADVLQQKADAPRQKANPARIEVLCDGYPLKELNAKSIAEYKKVTPANVTYYSKRFAEYLEEIAEQELAITD